MFNKYLDWGITPNTMIMNIIYVLVLMYSFITQYKKTHSQMIMVSGLITYSITKSDSRWCLYTNIWAFIWLFNN